VSATALHLQSVRTRAVRVPMKHVLGTSAAAVREAPLLLVDLLTREGVVGRSYQFCYTPAAVPGIRAIIDDAASALRGERIAPEALWETLARRYRLIGVQGIVRMAMATLDVAAWDALAIAAGAPLAIFLGGEAKPVQAYNSCGLGLMAPEAVAAEGEALLHSGFRALKLRLGYPTAEGDLTALSALRSNVGAAVTVMADYNQALGVEEAIERGRRLDAYELAWIEEPILHDDYVGCARVAAAVRTPVQIGENFSQAGDFDKALAAGAMDFVMPDLERIGGVSGWLRAAKIAGDRGLPMSSHLYPEVSVHLLAVTPTAHWLEYVDWANAIVEEPLRIAGGYAFPAQRPGNGLAWDEKAVRRYALR